MWTFARRAVATTTAAVLLAVGAAAPSLAGTRTVSEGELTMKVSAPSSVTTKVSREVVVTVDATITATKPIASVDAYVTAENYGGSGDFTFADFYKVSGSKYRAKLVMGSSALPGTWYLSTRVWVDYTDEDYEYMTDDNILTVKVRAPGRLTVDATPEPVKKGGTVTVAGKASRWDGYGWKAAKRVTVRIYFDPAGSAGPKLKAKVTTTNAGKFSRKFKQTTSGTWVVKMEQTSKWTAATAKDSVRVR